MSSLKHSTMSEEQLVLGLVQDCSLAMFRVNTGGEILCSALANPNVPTGNCGQVVRNGRHVQQNHVFELSCVHLGEFACIRPQ